MEVKFLYVIVLGFGFMFLFTSFQTMGNIEKVILDSIAQDDPSFKGDGYTSLAIIYAAFALFNWVTPSVLSVLGPRGAMLLGGLAYCLFMVTFLWPKTWLLYLASAVLGFGAAITWTGQGTYLSRCSNSENISRNSGIFWAMLQMSMFFGNLFVFITFQGKTHIDEATRQLVFSVLIAVAIIGLVFLAGLRPVEETRVETVESSDGDYNDPPVDGASENQMIKVFKSSVRLFFTKEMRLLSVAFFYTGLELSFFSGVYSSSVGFTSAFGPDAKKLVGLSGICIGIGEVFGGVTFGLLGTKTTRFGRDPIFILGFVVHVISFFLIYLNLPHVAPFGDTTEVSIFNPPFASVALLCAFLLGFGDACFNTQIYSILGGNFAKNSAAAFSIFKFVQSLAAAASFVYSSHLGLRSQMGILLVSGILGTGSFCLVEWRSRRQQLLDSPKK